MKTKWIVRASGCTAGIRRGMLSLAACLPACLWPLAAQQTEPKEANCIRIMSYNVHNFVGTDGERDYGRIAGVINRAAPDLVAIQEADSATLRSEGVYTLGELAARTLMHPAFAPAIDWQGGKYGIGILSKEKPLSLRRIPLPGREEKRALLIAEFEKYALACTHFSLTEEDRLASVALIKEAVKAISKPLFLAGDMNSTPGSPPQAALCEQFDLLSDPQVNTSPSVRPDCCIDYIYACKNNPGYTLLQRKVISEPLASDHLPLFVDVRLEAGSSAISGTKAYLRHPAAKGITVPGFTEAP